MVYDATFADQFQGEFSTESLPALSCDFYNLPDDVVRGITLTSSGPADYCQTFDGKLENPEPCVHLKTEFEDVDVPPRLSDELRAYLEVTTLPLSEQAPRTAGNKLLTFLKKVVEARVNRVNWKKFSIRADAVLELRSCNIKVRIYQEDAGCIVEFQRRSGDALAFMQLYRRAALYLQGPSSDQAARIGGNLPQIPHTMGSLPPDQAIAPLLNMVQSSADVHLLAEVASALSTMAADPMVAQELRMPCAFSALQQLQQVNDLSVALPTSRLLACI